MQLKKYDLCFSFQTVCMQRKAQFLDVFCDASIQNHVSAQILHRLQPVNGIITHFVAVPLLVIVVTKERCTQILVTATRRPMGRMSMCS